MMTTYGTFVGPVIIFLSKVSSRTLGMESRKIPCLTVPYRVWLGLAWGGIFFILWNIIYMIYNQIERNELKERGGGELR